jgi:hypothetical protein
MNNMQMEEDLKRMALESYGFGNWQGPYWFLGPEQAMSKNDAELNRRFEAWRDLGCHDLDDCSEFHRRINIHHLHGRSVPAKLQPTWAKLLLVLMSHFDPPRCAGDRLLYQVNEWGRLGGETCVIELSGLAAHSQRVERSAESFLPLPERITKIRDMMRKYEPKFVLLYGRGRNGSCEKAWEKLTEGGAIIEEGTFAKIGRSSSTLIAWALRHPVSFGQTNENWTKLGIKLRDLTRR